MNMVPRWTPLLRYVLMLIAGWLVREGWIEAQLASDIANDPLAIEFFAGILVAVGTWVWYLWSKSRKALIEVLT